MFFFPISLPVEQSLTGSEKIFHQILSDKIVINEMHIRIQDDTASNKSFLCNGHQTYKQTAVFSQTSRSFAGISQNCFRFSFTFILRLDKRRCNLTMVKRTVYCTSLTFVSFCLTLPASLSLCNSHTRTATFTGRSGTFI